MEKDEANNYITKEEGIGNCEKVLLILSADFYIFKHFYFRLIREFPVKRNRYLFLLCQWLFAGPADNSI